MEMQYFRSLFFDFWIGKAIFSVLSFRILERKCNIFDPYFLNFVVEKQYFRYLVFGFLSGNAIFSILSFRIFEWKCNIFDP